jgi:hypothetical protein
MLIWFDIYESKNPVILIWRMLYTVNLYFLQVLSNRVIQVGCMPVVKSLTKWRKHVFLIHPGKAKAVIYCPIYDFVSVVYFVEVKPISRSSQFCVVTNDNLFKLLSCFVDVITQPISLNLTPARFLIEMFKTWDGI